MQRTFKSKIGFYSYVLLLLLVIALIYSMWVRSVGLLTVMLVLNVLFVPSFIRTEYTFCKGALYLKSGYLATIGIEISSISEIGLHPDKISLFRSNPLKRYALSGDYLVICYGDNEKAMISPTDKEGFVREVVKRNPDVKIV